MATDLRESLAPLGKRVKKARDQGKNWAEIASDEGTASGKVQLAYLFQVVDTELGGPIKFKDEADLGKKLIPLRKDDGSGLSWGVLSARTNVSESRLRTLFTQAGGGSHKGNRIGKGGRHPGSSNGAAVKVRGKSQAARGKERAAQAKANAAKKAQKPTAKKATKVTKVAKATQKPVTQMNLKELRERINGRTVLVQHQDGQKENLDIDVVRKLSKGVATVALTDGEERTVTVANLKSVKPTA